MLTVRPFTFGTRRGLTPAGSVLLPYGGSFSKGATVVICAGAAAAATATPPNTEAPARNSRLESPGHAVSFMVPPYALHVAKVMRHQSSVECLQEIRARVPDSERSSGDSHPEVIAMVRCAFVVNALRYGTQERESSTTTIRIRWRRRGCRRRLSRIERRGIVLEVQCDAVSVNGNRHRDTVLLVVRVAVADGVADDLLEHQLAAVARSGFESVAIEKGAKLTRALFETCAITGERDHILPSARSRRQVKRHDETRRYASSSLPAIGMMSDSLALSKT